MTTDRGTEPAVVLNATYLELIDLALEFPVDEYRHGIIRAAQHVLAKANACHRQPETSMFPMSSIIFPSVPTPVRTLKPLQRKGKRATPFEIMDSSTQQTEVLMAAGVMAAPGTEYGPCEAECQHRDCAATRQRAADPCNYCGKPIGYDTSFFREDDNEQGEQTFAHMLCTLEAMER